MLEQTSVTAYGHLIDGEIIDSATGGGIDVLDPSTGKVFARIPRGSAADVDRAVKAARSAFEGDWGAKSALERGRILMKVSALILENFEELTALESRDTGKPMKQARADITATARYFEYYGSAADKHHGETIPYSKGMTVLALRVPHGVTAHIIPWNYPSQIFGRSVGGALAAGNACVVKPAEDACLTPLRISELALEAGLPAGALNVVCGLGTEAGAALARHPGINHISFTGSPQTGTAVAKAAAENHVQVTLELGGKSPQVIFADADLDEALPVIVNAIIQNAGQTCAAGSRVLIERSIYDEVLARLSERFSALKVGAGVDDLDCGPIISAKQLERVTSLVDAALADGAKVVASASMTENAPEGGFFYPPMLLDGAAPESRLGQDEVFGPVLAAFPFEDEKDAIRIANATPYGLTASVWTQDGGRQMRCAHGIEAGQVFVNNYGAGGGIELPFGGMKRSGYGREKAFEGMISFTTIKTVVLKHG
ncbi:aldehyde dehydrogenase family protein [Rhizobium sp. EC-SD404]|uniref:aldehyde dehydrogenase family protein n=1 Tax=Rhizobium sp. EC-SD404 TaxID=2038389 RepID=UPI001257E57F|nr:aldehyde dehydrogenase family protein [Rhizobium sp. EC-SD404]VVT24401.1 NAD/NADP-dependent betaine aldehyde dehydrogenase [Rhizobium sp. EC-SD404]